MLPLCHAQAVLLSHQCNCTTYGQSLTWQWECCHLPPGTWHLPPVTCHLPPATCNMSPATYHPQPRDRWATCYLPPTDYHLQPANRHLPFATCQLSTTKCQKWFFRDFFLPNTNFATHFFPPEFFFLTEFFRYVFLLARKHNWARRAPPLQPKAESFCRS